MWPFSKKPGQSKPLSEAERKAALREEALANMRAARERLGDETIQKMAAALKDQDMKARAQRAMNDIRNADKKRVAEHVRNLLDEDK